MTEKHVIGRVYPQRPDTIRVASDSPILLVAGSIAKRIRKVGTADLRAVGATAVNNAVKSITIAQSYLWDEGIHLSYMSHFEDIDLDGSVITSICFEVTILKT